MNNCWRVNVPGQISCFLCWTTSLLDTTGLILVGAVCCVKYIRESWTMKRFIFQMKCANQYYLDVTEAWLKLLEGNKIPLVIISLVTNIIQIRLIIQSKLYSLFAVTLSLSTFSLECRFVWQLFLYLCPCQNFCASMCLFVSRWTGTTNVRILQFVFQCCATFQTYSKSIW